MKQKIEILNFEDKTAKSGKPYTTFTTDDGVMSVFEAEVIQQLKQIQGKVLVEVAESADGQFKNIRKIYNENLVLETPKVRVPEVKSNVERNKQAGVSLRYAVDLCIAGKIEYEAIHDVAKDILMSMHRLSTLNFDTYNEGE